MLIVTNFKHELRQFSKKNWWVYIIYFCMLLVIFLTQKANLPRVIIVTSLHFVADIFIMMMFSAYTQQKYRQGTYFQIFSLVIFISLKINNGLSEGGWYYLLADPIYILAAIKNYRLDVKKTGLKIVNFQTMVALSFLIIFSIKRFGVNTPIINTAPEWIQTLGIFLFAIALSTTHNERLRYEISLVALLAMVVGSAWKTASTLQSGNVDGLAISYTLLPLTVLLFYVNRWPMFFPKKILPDPYKM